mmetsp:Transcript_18240/g.42241  ORF Transcript_18240/g.42241 Transcript_18240/m.42241 type:complete len:457 (-) Transcript_18240:134-1504(-)
MKRTAMQSLLWLLPVVLSVIAPTAFSFQPFLSKQSPRRYSSRQWLSSVATENSKSTPARSTTSKQTTSETAAATAVAETTTTTEKKAASSGTKAKVHLLSLRPYLDDTCEDVWEWKESVLGNGWTVPKPITLRKINQCLVDAMPDYLEECCVISTCARFEFLVFLKNHPDALSKVTKGISRFLVAQMRYDRALQMPFNRHEHYSGKDRPGRINPEMKPKYDDTTQAVLEENWKVIDGVEDVCRYLCCAAAGMQPYPGEPDRPVDFRPFASRNAHILCQLKYCARGTFGERAKAKPLMDATLRAGKMARDVRVVPEIHDVRPVRGPIEADFERAKAAVQVKAIEPIVKACVEKYDAMMYGNTIAQFRAKAEALCENDDEIRWVRKQVHKPTMDLRSGKAIDMRYFLRKITQSLKERRLLKAQNAQRITPEMFQQAQSGDKPNNNGAPRRKFAQKHRE